MDSVHYYTSKVATNGQVVVPKEVRDLLFLSPGTKVIFTVKRDNEGNSQVTISKRVPQFAEMVGALRGLKKK